MTNKSRQEQIEKMVTILACGRCGQLSWDCPEDEGLKCYGKEEARPTATLLVSKGYINGADFVEWLKTKFLYLINEAGHVVDIRTLDEALQEYLKGE